MLDGETEVVVEAGVRSRGRVRGKNFENLVLNNVMRNERDQSF